MIATNILGAIVGLGIIIVFVFIILIVLNAIVWLTDKNAEEQNAINETIKYKPDPKNHPKNDAYVVITKEEYMELKQKWEDAVDEVLEEKPKNTLEDYINNSKLFYEDE